MKKKLLALLLIATMVAGCGSAQTVDSQATESQATESQVAESQAEESQVEESQTTESTESQDDAAQAIDFSDATVVGEDTAAHSFNFLVKDADGNETKFVINTDETVVGAALLAAELIAGEDSDYGLYVKTVNGVTADYDVDGSYWAFYIDGEYATTGVDSTDIVDGAVYTFAVEK